MSDSKPSADKTIPSPDDVYRSVMGNVGALAAKDLRLAPFRRLMETVAKDFLVWEHGELERDTDAGAAHEAIIRTLAWILTQTVGDGRLSFAENAAQIIRFVAELQITSLLLVTNARPVMPNEANAGHA